MNGWIMQSIYPKLTCMSASVTTLETGMTSNHFCNRLRGSKPEMLYTHSSTNNTPIMISVLSWAIMSALDDEIHVV